jgi:phenylalanyl-tRNA synthetase alpha chain
MPDEILLNEAAFAVWQTVKDRGPIELGEVVKLTGVDQAQVSAVATEAAQRGFFDIEETEREDLIRSESATEMLQSGLPEFRAAAHLAKNSNQLPMEEFLAWANINDLATSEILKWGTARGWIEKTKSHGKTLVILTERGQKGIQSEFKDDDVYVLINYPSPIAFDSLKAEESAKNRVRQLLGKRPELAKFKKRTERTISITSPGATAWRDQVKQVIERNSLTPEDLESGAWREIRLRPYDVKLPGKDIYPAKIHPLRKIIEQTRRAFLEMGFAEVASPMVESAFWNFDALFQPQDHPAREMQDTFYMRHPATTPLPDAKVTEPVRRTHEDGWETGSEGWGYTWSPEVSKKVVLRTHTTAATIRALAANPNPPGKFFCVGWTYRNETISFKHLPVFHQVDGMIIDEEANLASLMGTLQEFYSKMGFGRVKFKPAFYPYTEPSVDVVVYMESRGKWLEMGGAGIFRPEVTLPLGCKHPVLAWGLGIERLAMLRFGLSDIRDLYGTNLNELEKVPLCR